MTQSPSLKGLVFESSGSKLYGALYCAIGTTPHPTALLLHGIPGLEKNSDLAHALQDKGWNALIFHYRGCWGSEGDYSLVGIPDDIREAISHLTSGEYPVDPKRIALVGHGLGGWAALVAASRDHRVRAVVTYNGVTNTRTASMVEDRADDFVRFLHGITSRGLQSQWRALGAMCNPVDLVADIEPRPMLIIHSTSDAEIPMAQAMEFKQRAGADAELHLVEGNDHWFAGHRQQIIKVTIAWLEKKLFNLESII